MNDHDAHEETEPPDTESSGDAPDQSGEAAESPDPMAQLTAERDRLKDQLLRTAADYDNFRKRTKRELEDARRRGQEETIREILPVLDNLERALDAAAHAPDVGAVAEGVRMVLKGFEDVAQRLGLRRLEAIGNPFDPNEHDAIQQQETEEHPPGTVVAEVVPGYRLGERLLRPALVVVARPPAKD
ncbi:MAG: nucleotide exchange factor GrpE [Myxococcales bacterium]|nr:nucleotide exchange factor GrpE [Myxococcales bacterium]